MISAGSIISVHYRGFILLCIAYVQVQPCGISLTTDRNMVDLGSIIIMTCRTCRTSQQVLITLNGISAAQYWQPVGATVVNRNKSSISTNITDDFIFIYFTVFNFTKNQAGTYSCFFYGTTNASTVNITDTIPVTYVHMIPTVTTVYLLAITTTFSCFSSIGRPTPAIRWYMVNKTLGYSSADSDISKYAISNTSYSANGDVITSYLILTPSTDDHGKILYCNVSNGYGQITSDHTPVIVILRLPSKPVIFHNSSTVIGIYRVIENQTVSLTCSSDGNPPPTVTWITPQNLTKTTSVLTITNISTTDTGVYTCRANSTLLPTTGQPIDDISTTNVSAEVLYPPRPPECRIGNVTVTSNVVRAIRNESFRLTCTSGSNPMPSNYTWTLPLGDRVRGQELLIEALRSIGDDIYDIRIVNLMNPSFQQSLEGSIEQPFKLDILYPVEAPTIYYVRPNQHQEINEVNIIRGQTVHLQCNSSSNPQPNYEWSTKEVVSAQGAFWNQTIGTHQVVVCNASNCMDPTGHTTVCQSRVAYLNITAYFPPDTPLLSFTTCGHAFTTSTLKIIEGQSVNVSCSSMSNPDPTYTWNQSKQLQGNTLVIENITLTQNGTYSCTAINIMNTTFDGTVMGENTSTFHLDILVPPRVYHIENKTVILNTNFSVVCPYKVGNPSSTTIVWTRERETHIADPNLSILDIKLTDEGIYTCTASNKMEPTNCSSRQGYARTSFFLDVQYAAQITRYVAIGYDNQMVINATENDDVHLVCEFDSDPVANISILNGTRILKRGHNNTLVATISHARCEYDAAVYSCRGGNIHSNSTGMQERVLEVFVKCAPRISPFSPPVTNISRTINGSVVLTFTIKAYPSPDRAAYSWYRLNDSAWITIIDVHTANISISANGLQTNMSISRLQSADFGRYRVSVYNDLGNATQEYELRAHDKPEPPKNINVKEGSLNVDSFTVEWEPGFNGGEEQTFSIQYKPMESTLQWTDVNVSSNSWKYTLLGLQSGTTYFIKMFARNIVGISDETDVVTATTLVSFAYSPSSLTAVAVGASIGGIVCITLSVVGVFCWKKRKPTKQKQVVMQYEDLIGQRGYEDAIITNASYEICQFDPRPENKYEALGETTFHQYSSLSLDKIPTDNKDATESSEPSTTFKEYENLTLR